MYDSVFRCSVIKVHLLFYSLFFHCAVFPAPALLYYHIVYALVNNFFHFFYSFFYSKNFKIKQLKNVYAFTKKTDDYPARQLRKTKVKIPRHTIPQIRRHCESVY